MHGRSNSGKSTIIKMLDKIFSCYMYRPTAGNFDIVPDVPKSKF